MADAILDLTELSLVAGPIELPDPAYSFDDNWTTEIYTPSEIANAILAVPNVRLIHGSSPNWDAWDARWEFDDHYILFDVNACPIDLDNDVRPGISTYWGGSKFETHCTMIELLNAWHAIMDTCPGVCLHDTDCRMYSPTTFQLAFGRLA